MKKQEFDILNSLYNGSIGRAICSYDIETKNALADNETYRRMIKSGYICENDNSLTELGRNALENYRVNNAVILAAGASTRFIPLSLEQPIGLYEEKGEKLNEKIKAAETVTFTWVTAPEGTSTTDVSQNKDGSDV